ncbi:hypothetical protein KP509_20G085000 [Ceratopteris richardii]|uniref:Protein kinase domain-containing protein n=1 Tax=Ceratopteris richardii TaxID=49495 RepID=A0A8T2SGZ9_CERRI|nr:hypothetical protein KP509_20G085000 [Ceratopteris richardii]
MGSSCISSKGALPLRSSITCTHIENTHTGKTTALAPKHVKIAGQRSFFSRKHGNPSYLKIRNKPSLIVNSFSYHDLVGNILGESGSDISIPSFSPIAASAQDSIPSFFTHIAQETQRTSLLNIWHAMCQYTEQISHSLTTNLGDLPPDTFFSGISVLAATVLFTLKSSASVVESVDKQNKFSLPSLNFLKESLLKLQNGVTKVHLLNIEKKQATANVEQALPLDYDIDMISQYYAKRPALVLSRICFILLECSILLVDVLLDYVLGRVSQTEHVRASQLADLITRLGPTAVKVGQALSVRPDLLPPAYIEQLKKLQDCVPAFSSDEARRTIFQELGASVDDIYSDFSEEPTAAASLGQVYKAKLRDTGEIVAVKVQRPDVLHTICLDLYIVRTLAITWQTLADQTSSDLVNFIDHWATHFFQELNYIQEAKNIEVFRENMRSLTKVLVPKVFTQYTSHKVLTTKWIDGEKLSESKEADVPQLLSVALNCYLIQLLETGFLHADPHPGNLLRTTNGQVCVLDFGLMLQVTEEQRYALIDYISHLVNSDYENVADDLIELGFLPPDSMSTELMAEILPKIGATLSRLVKSGSRDPMDIEQIIGELVQMTANYSIVIPPYFAMILRAFSMLEGIGLSKNPNYVIIEECYPYICKRLLTDDSPRARTALKYFLYGNKAQLNLSRIEAMLTGFQNFQKTMIPASTSSGSQVLRLDPTSQQILGSLLAPEGSFLQELLLAEVVRIVDALSREAAFELWNTFVGVLLPLNRVMPLPLSIPMLGFFGMSPTFSLSDEDQEAIALVKVLARFLGSELNKETVKGMSFVAHNIASFFPQISGGVISASTRFWIMLLHRKLLRFADDLDGENSLVYWNMDPAAIARNVKPLGFLASPKNNQTN